MRGYKFQNTDINLLSGKDGINLYNYPLCSIA